MQGLYTTVPNGFLLCNGAAYLRTAYPKLFAVINTIYNLPTDNTDIFRVPDLRNRTVMGANPAVAGKAGGNTSNVGDVQKASVPAIGAKCGRFASYGDAINVGAFYLDNYTSGGGWERNSGSYSRRIGFDSTRRGTSTDHLGDNVYTYNGEVRTANIRMNYIIKY